MVLVTASLARVMPHDAALRNASSIRHTPCKATANILCLLRNLRRRVSHQNVSPVVVLRRMKEPITVWVWLRKVERRGRHHRIRVHL